MGCRIWKPVAEALVSRGKRRVLAYDLFGRGFSDAAYPCDLSLFTGACVGVWVCGRASPSSHNFLTITKNIPPQAS